MVKVLASAPGKVTLFGEHAVVYGYPAIVTAIDKRVYVEAELRNDNTIKINAQDLRVSGLIVSISEGEVLVTTDYGRSLATMSYLSKAIEVTSRFLNERKGVNLVVTSEMPVGAGLGTSAAVSVATIAAYAKCLGHELSNEVIAQLGWEVEKEVQGIASPMDTTITALGGTLKLWYEGSTVYKKPLALSGELPLVISYVEREKTTKEMVAKVRELRNKHGELVDEIMKSIGLVTNKAEQALLKNDLNEVGLLMNINHGLLDALGVSTRRLNELVYLARSSGALGAKLTGAGGGGATISLVQESKAELVLSVLSMFSLMSFKATINTEGVKVKTLAK